MCVALRQCVTPWYWPITWSLPLSKRHWSWRGRLSDSPFRRISSYDSPPWMQSKQIIKIRLTVISHHTFSEVLTSKARNMSSLMQSLWELQNFASLHWSIFFICCQKHDYLDTMELLISNVGVILVKISFYLLDTCWIIVEEIIWCLRFASK